jgi:hypothetical protein
LLALTTGQYKKFNGTGTEKKQSLGQPKNLQNKYLKLNRSEPTGSLMELQLLTFFILVFVKLFNSGVGSISSFRKGAFRTL